MGQAGLPSPDLTVGKKLIVKAQLAISVVFVAVQTVCGERHFSKQGRQGEGRREEKCDHPCRGAEDQFAIAYKDSIIPSILSTGRTIIKHLTAFAALLYYSQNCLFSLRESAMQMYVFSSRKQILTPQIHQIF